MMQKSGYLALPILALASACGGAGGEPVTASNCGVIGGTCSTPTPEPTPSPSELFKAEVLTTYKGVGATQQITESIDGELYSGEQSKADTAKVEITYDPRDAVFTFKVDHEGSELDLRYQDPAHRTDFNNQLQPQATTPNIPLFNYLESGGRDHVSTFFYKQPGNGTRYVTLAGLNRNEDRDSDIKRIRGTYAFGSQTPLGTVPTRGTGRFQGDMLATMVRNVDRDTDPTRTRFEWIRGSAQVDVDFGAGSVTANLSGTVLPLQDAFESFGRYNAAVPGATFTATGTASFDSSRLNYAGSISRATVAGSDVSIAASSLDGTFFGPNAIETGGAFRVIGSIPDQRVDIMGSFIGAKPNK